MSPFITTPAETVPSFGLTGYLYTWIDVVDQTRETTFLAFIFLAGLLLLSPATPRKFRELTGVLLAAAAARLMLFPHIEDRYLVAMYAILGIAAMATLTRAVGRGQTDNSEDFAAQWAGSVEQPKQQAALGERFGRPRVIAVDE